MVHLRAWRVDLSLKVFWWAIKKNFYCNGQMPETLMRSGRNAFMNCFRSQLHKQERNVDERVNGKTKGEEEMRNTINYLLFLVLHNAAFTKFYLFAFLLFWRSAREPSRKIIKRNCYRKMSFVPWRNQFFPSFHQLCNFSPSKVLQSWWWWSSDEIWVKWRRILRTKNPSADENVSRRSVSSVLKLILVVLVV